jgi:hypothetical protein
MNPPFNIDMFDKETGKKQNYQDYHFIERAYDLFLKNGGTLGAILGGGKQKYLREDIQKAITYQKTEQRIFIEYNNQTDKSKNKKVNTTIIIITKGKSDAKYGVHDIKKEKEEREIKKKATKVEKEKPENMKKELEELNKKLKNWKGIKDDKNYFKMQKRRDKLIKDLEKIK